MSNETCDEKSVIRNVILSSQHLDKRSSKRVEDIVSDICGLQYDPNPTIHLNHYMMLWNRKKDFALEELDAAAYKEFTVTEAFAFKRNMFFIPTNEFAIYRAALKDVVRWGSSDESWLAAANNRSDLAAEEELKKGLKGQPGMTTSQIWECLHLSGEWDAYVKGRRAGDLSFELPIFRAFYRLKRKTDLVTCGRNPGTFKEPVFILKEKAGFSDWTEDAIEEKEAIKRIIEKLTASLGVTDPVHVSHISGYKTAAVISVFEELESEKKIVRLPYKIGRKYYYIHASKMRMLNENMDEECREVRLISPMDTIVRDKTWLAAFFDYSFSFEYFKKKGMKWPLSILAGNRFVGYLDCKMDWKTRKFMIKERNIFDDGFHDSKAIDLAIEELAAFHEAKEIVEKPQLR